LEFLRYLEKEELKKYTNALIENYAIITHKSQGQNFVINKSLIDDLISTVNLEEEDIVVEVGGGIGTVTYYLLQKCKRIFLYEMDPILSSVILKVFNDYKTKLDVNSGDFLLQDIPNHKKLVSNLPYNISSPFIKKITEMKHRPEILAVTFQKEFADHLCAEPGDSAYSRLSVHSSFFYKFTIIKTFSSHYFFPSPKVQSSIVRGTRLTPPEIVNDPDFPTFLINLFCRKHKKVRNNLQIYSKQYERNLRKNFMNEVDNLEFYSNQPKNLSPNEILRLFQEFKSLMKSFLN